jgi:EAL domain-containing protein (putative c-di-GMP-specific phosphodiesterase class I)
MAYKAKDAGKNRVMAPHEKDLIEEFRKAGAKSRMVIEALEQMSITPFYQPIVPLSPHLPHGCEVLCRFRQGGEAASMPELIEIAETIGIMWKFDLHLMEAAFTTAKAANYSGLIFCNLSPKSLLNKGFIDNLLHLTDRIGMDRSMIVFELTERETVKNLAMLEQIVADVKLQGFKIAIDDFGSGFSSFHYIRHLPIDYVKIEGLFVQNVLKDFRDMAFVKSLATLAGEFGITTIAEHIEDPEVLEVVRSLGINYAQGYHTGRPHPDLPCP